MHLPYTLSVCTQSYYDRSITSNAMATKGMDSSEISGLAVGGRNTRVRTIYLGLHSRVTLDATLEEANNCWGDYLAQFSMCLTASAHLV